MVETVHLICPFCGTDHALPAHRLPRGGSKVQCSSCRQKFALVSMALSRTPDCGVLFENRGAERYPFHASARFHPLGGAMVTGVVRDLSRSGCFLAEARPLERLSRLQKGFLQVALDEQWNRFLLFAVHVARGRGQGLGIAFSGAEADADWAGRWKERPPPTLFIRRSSGKVDPGWTLRLPGEHLPREVRARLRHFQVNSPPVICWKEESGAREPLFKLFAIEEIFQFQEWAARRVEQVEAADPEATTGDETIFVLPRWSGARY